MKKFKFKNPFSQKEKKVTTNQSTLATTGDLNQPSTKQSPKEKNTTKSILLIGRTGKGKSTLANVLTNTDEFKESSSSISETKKNQVERFTFNDIQYTVIDTPGIGDNRKELPPEKILDIIAEAIFLVREGVSHVFFITDGRFEKYEMATYNILREILFDKDVTQYTTIIRTKFKDFTKEEICEEDIKTIKEENEELREIITSCQSVLHLDNPSLRLLSSTNETTEAKIKREQRINDRQEIRNSSRNKLLEYLTKTIEKSDYISPKLQTELGKEIADDYSRYLEKKQELAKELENLKANTASSTNTQLPKSENDNNKLNKSSPVVENKQEPATENDNLAIGKIIVQLEDKRVKLKKEIEEKEEIIRQKVLKHIFNNYQDINNTLGSKDFIDSIIDFDKWKAINEQFTKELVKTWLNKNFNYEQVQRWSIALGNSFDPQQDAGFCEWLRDDKQLTVEKLKDLIHTYKIGQLRREYANQLEKEVNVYDQHHQQLAEISPAQQWLNDNYPLAERNKLTELNISDKELIGSLKLVGFSNLTGLYCQNNQLTSLDVSNCAGLTRLDCNNNQLTSLTIFSKLVNCQTLILDNNPFTDNSLAPLQHLTNLTVLSIEKTNLTGLEYLPTSLAEIYCTGKLAEQLVDYKIKDNKYNFQSWRKDQQKKLQTQIQIPPQ